MLQWLKKLFSPTPAPSLPAGTLLIDVREPQEYAAGHAPGAVNIPLAQLGSQIARLRASQPPALVLYCASGMRSAAACRQLQQAGFTQVYNARTRQQAAAWLQQSSFCRPDTP
ncbi:rhodanese-like domain-containing protein [Vogesella sp. LIG4]|uniref:rhodanese-like domain-containing protein n=1 Tax=Vogesella sp. LIG4 TaxID=1192162 RepID=UPI00081FD5FA|nr:rhodanese-like domain-containing protein [Vogesella sp. LIG4]SCK31000.1 Rhodanese-related sulfurtransferase [Vogesella sp. LIG4]